ncbi:MAG: dihydroorotase [Fusobacteriota bacterium]
MLLLKNGLIVDPENDLQGKMDILIKKGKIVEISENIEKTKEMQEYDLAGKVIFPGFIDMHVHLREPGQEYKETIETGLKAALAGGFTGVAPMPNTNPICDNQVMVEYLKNKERDLDLARIYPIGAITKGENGHELAEIGKMHTSGIVGISDDGVPVENSLLTRKAFEYIKKFDLPMISHSEDRSLSKNGVMNEGVYSIRLGLKGIPNEAEAVIVSRDILLCESRQSRLHIAHASTKESLRIIKDAKARGVDVTVEVTPHHFSLTDKEVFDQGYDTGTKVNPPLRDQEDMEYLIARIEDGTVDIISTDHAPHSKVDKVVDYDAAPFGISGLETAVGLVSDELVNNDVIDLKRMAELLSINPRKIFRIKDKGIKEGKIADLSIVDFKKEWTVNSDEFYSKGKNTPFNGKTLRGKPYMTVVNGEVKMIDGKLI